MAYAFVANVDAAASASTTTITRTITYAAGENIVVDVAWALASGTVTVADGTHTFNQVGATVVNSGQVRSLAKFYARNVAGGAFTITATFNASRSGRRISAGRYTGLGNEAGHDSAGLWQDGTTTAADQVTSGLMTPLSQPAMVHGLTHTFDDTSTVNAGTGFTSRGVLASWDALVSDTSRVEDKRVTSTSDVAATFTATSTTEEYLTLGAVFGEPSAAGVVPVLMRQYRTRKQ